jgi:mannose-6-phosphate isomerase-like protein (cupin superfamily)
VPTSPGIIGGIGLTHLTVYEQRPAPDGVNSGSPHVHAITDEGYYVLSGTGKAELHDQAHGFRTVSLKPGQFLQFPPCTLHRIVSADKLVILAVMGNAGLAERGDARIYFGKAVDDSPDEYARLAALAKEKGLEGALDRRDAAVRAYQELLKLWETDRKSYFEELDRFVGVHLRAIEEMRPKFADAVATGPLFWGRQSQARIDRLPLGVPTTDSYFHDGEPKTAYGMCGILRPVLDLQPVE